MYVAKQARNEETRRRNMRVRNCQRSRFGFVARQLCGHHRNTPIHPKTGSYMKARPKGYRSRETQKIMAENTGAYLTPEDIPCSSVRNGEDISKWTIPQLKFWLKCRRLNQQGLKKDLVEK